MKITLPKKSGLCLAVLALCTACGGGGSSTSSGGSSSDPAFSYTSLAALPTLSSAYPSGSAFSSNMVLGSDGNFYLVTNFPITVNRITPSGTVTPLYTMSNQQIGALKSFFQGSDGNFYGMLYVTGAAYGGAVFQMTPAGTGSIIYTFSLQTLPGMLIQGSDGNLYGTTSAGGTNGYGDVFKLTTSGAFTELYAPTSSAATVTTMTQGSDGNLYLAANQFEKLTTSGTLTALGSTLAMSPSVLLQAGDGNFYGVAYSQSDSSQSFVQITPSGTETVLYTFTGTGSCTTTIPLTTICTGPEPITLLLGKDGNFYGSTKYGSSTNSAGTLFKLTTGGQQTLIYDYGNTTSDAPGLVQGSDGKLYGVAWSLNGGSAPELFSVGL